MRADLNGPSFASLGSLECLQRLLQCVGVSDEGLNVHTARGYHLQGSRVATKFNKGSIDFLCSVIILYRHDNNYYCLPVSISKDAADVDLSH